MSKGSSKTKISSTNCLIKKWQERLKKSARTRPWEKLLRHKVIETINITLTWVRGTLISTNWCCSQMVLQKQSKSSSRLSSNRHPDLKSCNKSHNKLHLGIKSCLSNLSWKVSYITLHLRKTTPFTMRIESKNIASSPFHQLKLLIPFERPSTGILEQPTL